METQTLPRDDSHVPFWLDELHASFVGFPRFLNRN